MAYVNLPGTFPTFNDGGLTFSTPSTAPRILILGTATDGLSEQLYQVLRPNDAANEFGRDGTLVQGMYESLAQGADNVFLLRTGGTRGNLTGVGDVAGVAGYTITPNRKDDDVGTRYSIYYESTADLLLIYDNDLEDYIYSNDPAGAFDLGHVSITGSAVAPLASNPDIGTVSAPVTFVAADATTGVTFTAGTDGAAVSLMERWEALNDAYELLEFQTFDFVVPQGVYTDSLNVVDGGTVHILGTNTYPVQGAVDDGLGKVFIQNYQGMNYFWWDTDDDGTAEIFPSVGSATATTDADGNTINNFNEVSFGYQLANFCFASTENFQACLGMIGVTPPTSLGLADIASWVGELPEYTINTVTGVGTVAASGDNGTGLLGNKFMAGKAAFRAGERYGGFIASDTTFIDGTEQVDENGYVVDIGKYISVVAAWVVHLNSYDQSGRGYLGSFAAAYAGLVSNLNAASAPTNKLVRRVQLPYRIGASALDNLVGLRYVMLVNKSRGTVVADAPSAARPQSDYNRLTTSRIVTETVQRIREAADGFIGESMNTQRNAALNTAIEQALSVLKSEGKLQNFRFQLRMSARDIVLGNAYLDLILVPAFELRRLFVTVSLSGSLA